MNSSMVSNSWTEEVRARLEELIAGVPLEWLSRNGADIRAALGEIERQGRALNIAAVELEVARGALAKTQAERDRARLDLREAVRGGAVLARERNEAVERLTWVIKGAHGALTDAGTVVVPGVLDGDIGAAIRQVTCERDEARAERDTAAENYLLMVDNVEKLHAEVERLRSGIEDNAARWSEMARALTAKAERAEAALYEAAMSLETIAEAGGSTHLSDGLLEAMSQVRGYARNRAGVARAALAGEGAKARVRELEAALTEWRKHDSAPDCVACAVLDAATCGTLAGEGKP